MKEAFVKQMIGPKEIYKFLSDLVSQPCVRCLSRCESMKAMNAKPIARIAKNVSMIPCPPERVCRPRLGTKA